VHQEACRHLHRTLQLIRSHGAKVGVVLNPATPVESLSEVLELVDYVLLMSVNPGFGGQKFIPAVLRKMPWLLEMRATRKLNFRVEIDGGVAADTIGEIVRAGVEILVAGNAVFGKGDPAENVRRLQKLANEASLVKV
jgi:ribulose-phosphate 3-epimerase